MSNILYNAIRTPDGTVLESLHGWDYKSHLDKVTGKVYGVDGGLNYYRRTGDYEDCQELSLEYGDSHAEIREVFKWKSYGKNGDQPGKWIKLKEMTDEHVSSILGTQNHIRETVVFQIFMDELRYRIDNNIEIKE